MSEQSLGRRAGKDFGRPRAVETQPSIHGSKNDAFGANPLFNSGVSLLQRFLSSNCDCISLCYRPGHRKG